MDLSPRRRPPLALDLTPLIDVVFLLLLYFMVTTTAVGESETQGVQVELPRSSSVSAIPEGHDLTLELTVDGAVSVNGQALSAAMVSAELRKAAQADTSTLVVLRADAGVAHGRVVEVMDLARQLGLTSFAFATEAGGGPVEPAALPAALRRPGAADSELVAPP